MSRWGCLVEVPTQHSMSQSTVSTASPRISPALGIGVGIIAISFGSIFVRYAQGAGAPSLTIAALRLTIAALILLPFAWWRCRTELKTLSSRDLLIGMLSGLFLGVHFATWITSLQYTSVASSVVLVTLSPLFIALASALFLREKLARLALGGVLIAVVGGIVISLGDTGQVSAGANPPLGNLLAVLGAVSIAPHFLIGRRLRQKLSLLAYISLVYGAAAIVLLLAVGLTRSELVGFDPQAYVWMALLALIPQLIGHTSFNWSLGHLPATYATIPALGEPIGSTLLAILLLGEVLTPLKIVGGLLVLAGIAIMTVSRTQDVRQIAETAL
jgi:drug/metabolite transporter (DMT)-like permease